MSDPLYTDRMRDESEILTELRDYRHRKSMRSHERWAAEHGTGLRDPRLRDKVEVGFAHDLAISQEYATGPDTIEAATADYVRGRIEVGLLEYRIGLVVEREEACAQRELYGTTEADR